MWIEKLIQCVDGVTDEELKLVEPDGEVRSSDTILGEMDRRLRCLYYVVRYCEKDLQLAAAAAILCPVKDRPDAEETILRSGLRAKTAFGVFWNEIREAYPTLYSSELVAGLRSEWLVVAFCGQPNANDRQGMPVRLHIGPFDLDDFAEADFGSPDDGSDEGGNGPH